MCVRAQSSSQMGSCISKLNRSSRIPKNTHWHESSSSKELWKMFSTEVGRLCPWGAGLSSESCEWLASAACYAISSVFLGAELAWLECFAETQTSVAVSTLPSHTTSWNKMKPCQRRGTSGHTEYRSLQRCFVLCVRGGKPKGRS